MIVLELAGITKAYGARVALSGVTLSVAAGELVLLVGKNGAGKTTLLRIATGFLDPDAGRVTIDGIALAPCRDASERARAQHKLGYLPESAPVPPELTVREHLMLRARLKRATRALRAAEAVDAAMTAAAVASEADRRIGTLSKGYRQRVGLADALLGDPPLLVLDEPTSGMDPIQVRQLRELIAGSAARRAVLLSSHAVADLAPIATRICVLREGEVVADDSADALCALAGCARIDDAVIALLARVPA